MSLIPKCDRDHVRRMKTNRKKWEYVHSLNTNDYEYVIKLSKFLENYVLKLASTGRLRNISCTRRFGYYSLRHLLTAAKEHSSELYWQSPLKKSFLKQFNRNMETFLKIRNDLTHKLAVTKLDRKPKPTQKDVIVLSFEGLVKALTDIRKEQKSFDQWHGVKRNSLTVNMKLRSIESNVFLKILRT